MFCIIGKGKGRLEYITDAENEDNLNYQIIIERNTLFEQLRLFKNIFNIDDILWVKQYA